MKAISIRQPWAWAILNAGKRIENRSRVDGRMPAMCSHRGPLLIHVSKSLTLVEYGSAGLFMAGRDIATFQGSQTKGPSVPEPGALPRGGIVGACNVVDAVHTTLGGHRWHARDDRTCLLCGGSVDERAPRCTKPDPWAVLNSFGLILDDVRPLPFTPFKGALGLFEVPESIVGPLLIEAP